MHAYSNTELQKTIPVITSNVSSNRIKIQEILLILQLETDYFSKLFISEMHSKQWHYSLHRDFQNCYSTRRSLTRFFSSNSSFNPTRAHYREFSIQNPILHAEDKELFEYYNPVPEILRIEGKEIF